MEREHRYYVAKIKDVEKYLSDEHQLQFDRLLTKIRIGRLNDGKADVQTVCVDSDWPEYETVWRMIEARVDGKASPASAPENKALLEAVAEVVWYDPQLSHFPEKPGKIIDGSIAFMESAEIGTKLFAAPTPPVSEDRKDAERLDYLQDHGATVSVVWLPIVRLLGFEVGGLRKTRKPSLRDAIDAAMQEDKKP